MTKPKPKKDKFMGPAEVVPILVGLAADQIEPPKNDKFSDGFRDHVGARIGMALLEAEVLRSATESEGKVVDMDTQQPWTPEGIIEGVVNDPLLGITPEQAVYFRKFGASLAELTHSLMEEFPPDHYEVSA